MRENREECGEEGGKKDGNKLGCTDCHLTEGVSFPKMEERDVRHLFLPACVEPALS